MTPADTKTIKWAIKTYWRSKTDDQLAHSLHTTPDVITKMRQTLNFKGTESLKDYCRRYLLEMTEPEKKEFMSRLPAELIWRMSEGSPATSGTLEVSTEPIRIDISHQLETVYGKRIITQLPTDSETGRLPAGTSK